jgi:hypothetical protein
MRDTHKELSKSNLILLMLFSHCTSVCTVGYNMLTIFFGPEISAQYVGTLRSSRRSKNDPIWKPKVALESK